MPHQCVHCSAVYDDGSEEILKGCGECNSRFFFYLTQEKLDQIEKNKEKTALNISTDEKDQIEKDVREIAGIEDEEAPVILNFESVKILKPGKYVFDVANLFSKERPLVYKLEDGKYMIDLTSQLDISGNEDKD